MHADTLPVPIRDHPKYENDFECICKCCRSPKKYLKVWDGYSCLWNRCMLCQARVWYYPRICTLYGKRSPELVCFHCRVPFYARGQSSGDAYRHARAQRTLKKAFVYF